MKIHKVYIIVGLILSFCLFFELAAHADEGNQETHLTFNTPIEIPGQALPAGTYVFQIAELAGNQDVVRIFNADRTVLYATLQTVSAERTEPTGQTSITLADQGFGKPSVLVNWFYPGRTIGHEFVYSKQKQQELAHDEQVTIVADQRSSSPAAAAGN